MKRSESISKLAAALVKAQRKIGAAKKDSANPFFKSKYADLGAVMEACKEAFNSEGISVLQPVTYTADGKHAVETTLLHESGEYISETMALELTVAKMQDLGSAISYARRYSLQAMGFIPAEDDDAEASMGRKHSNYPQAASKVTVTTTTAENKEVEASPASPPAKPAATSTFRKPATKPAAVSKAAPSTEEEWV